MRFAALLVWRLLLCEASGVGVADPVQVQKHAARVAIASLEDVFTLMEQVGAQERSFLDASDASALEVYTRIHDPLGHFLEVALSALRHAAIACSDEGAAQVSSLANLDEQLSGLLSVHLKEPLFFWHGPKRLVTAKLQELFSVSWQDGALVPVDAGARSMYTCLRSAAAEGTLQEPPAALPTILGSEQPLEPKRSLRAAAAKGGVPPVGVVAGDSDCGASSSMPAGEVQAAWVKAGPGVGKSTPSCNRLAPALRAAGAVTADDSRSHLVVFPCSMDTLQGLGAMLRDEGARSAPPLPGSLSVFVSFVLSAEVVALGGARVLEAVRAASEALDRIDLLWLPFDAFKKVAWPSVQQVLKKLVEEGVIGSFGLHTEARTKKLLTKLLDREPRPAAWMTKHDVMRPISAEALLVAQSGPYSLPVVALPRLAGPGMLGVGLGRSLELAVGADPAVQEAAQHRWALDQGMAVALHAGGSSSAPALLDVFGGLKTLQLGATAVATLDSVQNFTGVFKGKVTSSETASRPDLSRGLVSGGLDWWRTFKSELLAGDSAADGWQPLVKTAQGELFRPGVRAETLAALDEQRKQYEANKYVIYKEDFFDEATWSAILAETQRLWKSHDIEGNCNLDGVDRLGGYVLDHRALNSSLYRLIYGNEQFRRWVSEVNAEGPMWPSDFPIELREYTTGSRGMGCHSDLQMYAVAPKDLEFAVTVDNLSKCNVTFWDAKGDLHMVNTRGNSVMMVRANAARHCVSTTAGGSRTIIKFIFVGDYRKSNEFWYYTGNECTPDNPNNVLLRMRREEEGGAHGTLEL